MHECLSVYVCVCACLMTVRTNHINPTYRWRYSPTTPDKLHLDWFSGDERTGKKPVDPLRDCVSVKGLVSRVDGPSLPQSSPNREH